MLPWCLIKVLPLQKKSSSKKGVRCVHTPAFYSWGGPVDDYLRLAALLGELTQRLNFY